MTDFDDLRYRLQRLRGEDGIAKPPEAERAMAELLRPLLFADGYHLSEHETEGGIDWIAQRPAMGLGLATSIGIEYKHYMRGRPLESAAIRSALNAAVRRALDRILVIARHGFTQGAIDAARRAAPVRLELFSLEELSEWIDRVENGSPAIANEVSAVVRTLAHELALLVAQHPFALDHIEWRDLERLVARIVEGLGFDVTLTPPSKDGGKDVIANCHVLSTRHSYIIELKHWRSGKRVGSDAVKEFLEVVAAEKRDGGIFMSTSGYAAEAFSALGEVTRQRVRFGGSNKIVSLAQHYERSCLGLWSAPSSLPQVLFEFTE